MYGENTKTTAIPIYHHTACVYCMYVYYYVYAVALSTTLNKLLKNVLYHYNANHKCTLPDQTIENRVNNYQVCLVVFHWDTYMYIYMCTCIMAPNYLYCMQICGASF